jgi:hypothetical protein
MPAIPSLRRIPPWALAVAATVVAFAPPLALRALVPGDSETWSPLRLAGIAWATVWMLMGVRVYITRLDEAARAAQRWAWEWGGAIGLGLALAAAVTVVSNPALAQMIAEASQSDPWLDTSIAFLLGVMSAVAAAFLGFTVCWIGWWMAKR